MKETSLKQSLEKLRVSEKMNMKKLSEEEDGAESDSSSDLFDLPNHELDFFSSSLPVYETNYMESGEGIEGVPDVGEGANNGVVVVRGIEVQEAVEEVLHLPFRENLLLQNHLQHRLPEIQIRIVRFLPPTACYPPPLPASFNFPEQRRGEERRRNRGCFSNDLDLVT
ncbi:hypothetical protein SASPL_104239 [Salvia splendens]|uniref:Uncharacterized protein n=1 Tax=Salvia splendens TaxID=180675 RepID=A0A8X9A8A3_SALSN|nr:hypothetical protein SASPL_104239 [Salvia splendens]